MWLGSREPSRTDISLWGLGAVDGLAGREFWPFLMEPLRDEGPSRHCLEQTREGADRGPQRSPSGLPVLPTPQEDSLPTPTAGSGQERL